MKQRFLNQKLGKRTSRRSQLERAKAQFSKRASARGSKGRGNPGTNPP
jgi:hypothetical protein